MRPSVDPGRNINATAAKLLLKPATRQQLPGTCANAATWDNTFAAVARTGPSSAVRESR